MQKVWLYDAVFKQTFKDIKGKKVMRNVCIERFATEPVTAEITTIKIIVRVTYVPKHFTQYQGDLITTLHTCMSWLNLYI